MAQSQPEPKKINDLQKPSVEDVVKKSWDGKPIEPTQPKKKSGPRLSETW